MQRPASITPFRAVLGVGLWCALCAFGFTALSRYEGTPGPRADTPSWPTDCRLPLDRDRCSLVMAIHPCCPCSRATLEELAQVLEQCPGDAALYVLVFNPDPEPEGWTNRFAESLRQMIPEARAITDKNGHAARSFGALTSGHILLFDRGGNLQFSGGITAGRGHHGTSPDGATLANCLQGRAEAPVFTPVFGCPIIPDDDKPRSEP
jgi:hypothetical protein